MPDWWDKYDLAPLAPVAEGTAYTDPNSGQKAMLQGGKPVLLGTQKLTGDDPKTMQEIHEDARMGANMAGAAQQFAAANAQTPTGPWRRPLSVPVLGDVNPFSVANTKDPNIKTMSQLGTQMATNAKIPGARTTQFEFTKFLGGAPGVTDFTEANAGAQANADNLHIATGAKQAFYDSWLRTHATLNGAGDAWGQWRDSQLPKYYQGAARQGGPPGGTPQAAPAPASSPRAQANAAMKTQSARAQLPPGVKDLGPE